MNLSPHFHSSHAALPKAHDVTPLDQSGGAFPRKETSIRHKQNSRLAGRVAQNDMIVFFFYTQITFESIQNLLVLGQLFRGTEPTYDNVRVNRQLIA